VSVQLPAHLFGREAELAVLRGATAQLLAGIGGVVLVEGEPGIGKSSLVAAAAVAAEESGCAVLSGMADQVAYPLPLRLLFDCLEITQRVSDPRRAEIARITHGGYKFVLVAGPDELGEAHLHGTVRRGCNPASLRPIVEKRPT